MTAHRAPAFVFASLVLVASSSARALPEDAIGAGIGAGIGTVLGGVAGFGAVVAMSNNGVSLAGSLSITDTNTSVVVDVFAVPLVGVLAGAAIGTFIATATSGDPLSLAPVAAACGAGIVGCACATPGMLCAADSLNQADSASSCGEAIGAAIAAVFFVGVGVASFCVGAPLGGAVGGGAAAAATATEEIPPPSRPSDAPADPTTTTPAPVPPIEEPPAPDPTPEAPSSLDPPSTLDPPPPLDPA